MTSASQVHKSELDLFHTSEHILGDNTPGHVLNVAIVGAGGIAKRHVKAIRRSKRVRLAMLCDQRTEVARALVGNADVEVVDQMQAALDDPAIEVIYLCTPNFLHDTMTIQAMGAGKHVFVEKPLAITADRARRVAQEAERLQQAVIVGHQYRYLPSYRQVRQWIDQDRVGEVRLVIDRITADYRVEARPQWLVEKATAGGGVFMNNGVHQIDRICWLLGETPQRINASAGRHFSRGDIESDVTATLSMPSGRSATIISAGYCGQVINALEVIGTEGQITVDTAHRVSLWHEAEPIEQVDLPDPTQGSELLLDVLIDAAMLGRKPEVDAAWGAEVVAVAEAIYESASIGQTIDFDAAPGVFS